MFHMDLSILHSQLMVFKNMHQYAKYHYDNELINARILYVVQHNTHLHLSRIFYEVMESTKCVAWFKPSRLSVEYFN